VYIPVGSAQKKNPAGDLTALTNDDRLLAGCCCFLPGRPMASRTYGRGTGGLLSVSAGTLRHSVGAQLRADRDVNGAARPFTRQLAPRAGRARLAVHASSSRLPSCDCESRPAGWFAARCSRRSFRGAPRAAASRPAGLTASLTAQSQAHSDRLATYQCKAPRTASKAWLPDASLHYIELVDRPPPMAFPPPSIDGTAN